MALLRPRLPLRIAPEVAQYLKMGIKTYRGRLLVQLSFWVAALAVGVAAVYFSKLIAGVQDWYSYWYWVHPYWAAAFTPVCFVAAAGVVRWLAPAAGGSGVPQVLYATELSREEGASAKAAYPEVALRTAAVKVLSTCLGFAGGASIGGEGPTVQISAAIFGTIGHRLRRFFPQLDFQSYLVAAAGAGIGAAFNTPLGGVAFALEEFTALGGFGPLRHLVLLAVIASGLTAQAIMGDALYFGHPDLRFGGFGLAGWAVVIGAGGGILGGIFGRIVIWTGWERLRMAWWVRALIFGLAVTAIGLTFGGKTAGSGYAVTKDFFDNRVTALPLSFPIAKLVATAFSTLSGMGGGILAPSLSIGAWAGVSLGKVAAFADPRVCALLGMTAYFAGAFQIPITAIIVCMEMTNEHDVIFPMMISALVAFAVARLIMPVSLYEVLIQRWAERHGHGREAGGAASGVKIPFEVDPTDGINKT